VERTSLPRFSGSESPSFETSVEDKVLHGTVCTLELTLHTHRCLSNNATFSYRKRCALASAELKKAFSQILHIPGIHKMPRISQGSTLPITVLKDHSVPSIGLVKGVDSTTSM
jgi:hypothetical protein